MRSWEITYALFWIRYKQILQDIPFTVKDIRDGRMLGKAQCPRCKRIFPTLSARRAISRHVMYHCEQCYRKNFYLERKKKEVKSFKLKSSERI